MTSDDKYVARMGTCQYNYGRMRIKSSSSMGGYVYHCISYSIIYFVCFLTE